MITATACLASVCFTMSLIADKPYCYVAIAIQVLAVIAMRSAN
jgi:hypothetical protein